MYPSPKYPGLHEQVYDPLVLLHNAFLQQLCIGVTHSSISAIRVNKLLSYTYIGDYSKLSALIGWR